jgi:hypothetical protein
MNAYSAELMAENDKPINKPKPKSHRAESADDPKDMPVVTPAMRQKYVIRFDAWWWQNKSDIIFSNLPTWVRTLIPMIEARKVDSEFLNHPMIDPEDARLQDDDCKSTPAQTPAQSNQDSSA